MFRSQASSQQKIGGELISSSESQQRVRCKRGILPSARCRAADPNSSPNREIRLRNSSYNCPKLSATQKHRAGTREACANTSKKKENLESRNRRGKSEIGERKDMGALILGVEDTKLNEVPEMNGRMAAGKCEISDLQGSLSW